jgi:cell division protein ZapD
MATKHHREIDQQKLPSRAWIGESTSSPRIAPIARSWAALENSNFSAHRPVVDPEFRFEVPRKVSNKISYEQPLNERIRTFLRLDFMLQQLHATLEGTTTWDSRATLATLLDLQAVFSRADIKAEIMKELERLGSVLQKLCENPHVDGRKLATILDEIDTYNDRLHAMTGPIGQDLKNVEWLSAIRQRTSIPGGACPFDLPSYHFWLEQTAEQRIHDLKEWARSFELPMRAAQLAVRLIRDSSPRSQEVAVGGFYQQTLDPGTPCQMVRVTVPADCPYYAEISGGKHRFVVRFMQLHMDMRDTQASEDVPFQLTCATL